jgi:hypothetical protein
LTRGDVNGWQEYLRAASLTGTLNEGITVLRELFAIQMAMGVYVIEN